MADTLDECGVVYKIDCKNCKSSYVGQTGRQLRTRINEHKRSVKNNDATSALAEHAFHTGHTINIDKIKVLDCEHYKGRRLFSEMLHIYHTKNKMNRQMDTLKLKSCYKDIVDCWNTTDNRKLTSPRYNSRRVRGANDQESRRYSIFEQQVFALYTVSADLLCLHVRRVAHFQDLTSTTTFKNDCQTW